ncbi:MAG: sensor histidine kinase [Propionibacteriales bacterium]|nr:sensor histidine kinase [Propionibacteriales bacterium]
MPALNEVARSHTDLGSEDVEWLYMLIADWQIIADLSFADLVLWLPDRDGTGYWGGAQMRPTTGPTAIVDDLVGEFVPRGHRALLDAAYDERRIVREGDPEWRDDVPIRVETIPVIKAGALLGVVARNTNLLGVRTPSRLELSYLQTASDLTRMISLGAFPYDREFGEWSMPLQVGDGFVRTDGSGVVSYASPNAQSAFRRLGFTRDLIAEPFAQVAESLVPPSSRPTDETLAVTLSGLRPRESELANAQATVIVRVFPLQPGESHAGAAILLKDVTELRSRERDLLTKDATIREIHHRVKNNLQTVAALLRLQSRRVEATEARSALDEAVRRVTSIAIVHETLSETLDEQVEFDNVSDRLSAMVCDVASEMTDVTASRHGSFGLLGAEIATPLAVVVTEVMQNAVEHGFAGRAGRLGVRVVRSTGALHVEIEDDGMGLPQGFDPTTSGRLGLSIVRMLVESELGGTIAFGGGVLNGTRVTLDVPLAPELRQRQAG